MLVFAYLGRIILNPAVSVLEKWLGSRRLSVFTVMALLIILLVILSTSLFPIIKDQIVSLQTALSMETLTAADWEKRGGAIMSSPQCLGGSKADAQA